MADAAIDHGVKVLYMSTDYVFDGSKRDEYEEDDELAPINVYGRTKTAGESEVDRVPEHWIVRTSWIFGQGTNFISAVLKRAREGAPLRVVEDQIGRPTPATAVALGIAALIERDGRGIVHVAGDGEPCSWADLATFALRAADLDVPVERITTETYRRESRITVAPRPPYSVLSLEKARRLGIPLLDWREAVEREIGALG